MEPVNKGSSCCWPFSICCKGEKTPEKKKLLDSEPEKKTPPSPRMEDGKGKDRAPTPGTTPTRSDVVREQKLEGTPNYV